MKRLQLAVVASGHEAADECFAGGCGCGCGCVAALRLADVAGGPLLGPAAAGGCGSARCRAAEGWRLAVVAAMRLQWPRPWLWLRQVLWLSAMKCWRKRLGWISFGLRRCGWCVVVSAMKRLRKRLRHGCGCGCGCAAAADVKVAAKGVVSCHGCDAAARRRLEADEVEAEADAVEAELPV